MFARYSGYFPIIALPSFPGDARLQGPKTTFRRLPGSQGCRSPPRGTFPGLEREKGRASVHLWKLRPTEEQAAQWSLQQLLGQLLASTFLSCAVAMVVSSLKFMFFQISRMSSKACSDVHYYFNRFQI